MAPLALTPALKEIDLKLEDDNSNSSTTTAKVVAIPFPKNTVGILFGQMIAEWPQRFNTYLLDTDYIVIDPQVVWDASSKGSRFDITKVVPTTLQVPDKNVFSVGPFTDDRYIAVYCSHIRPGTSGFEPSDPHNTFQDFKIGGKNAISFTMVNAEDGGDTDYHDTVVGVAVVYLTK